MDYDWMEERCNSPNGRYRTNDYGLLNARLNWSEVPVAVGRLRFGLWGKTWRPHFFNGGMPSAVFGDPLSYGINVIYEY